MKNTIREQETIIFLGNALKEAHKFHNKHGKNIFKHSLGVFQLLKRLGQKEEVCIAGLLHDIFEDTHVTENVLRKKYGDLVADLVIANTLDKSLDITQGKIEMIQRCKHVGEGALLIKICDTYDSYLFYKNIGDIGETKRSVGIKELILHYCSESEFGKRGSKILKKII